MSRLDPDEITEAELSRLREDNFILSEALRPFAEMADWLDALAELNKAEIPGHHVVVQFSGGGGSNSLRVDDLRDARAALADRGSAPGKVPF